MGITRQDTAINTARMRKDSWNVCFALAVGNDDILDVALADRRDYAQMAAEIMSYIDTDKDRLLYEPLMQLTDSKPIWDYLLSDHDYREHDAELEVLAESLDKLREYGNGLYRGCGRGKLTPFFSNQKAEALLQRAVDAGLLNEDFMPAEGTHAFQLKLIAIAFNKILGYGVRDKWCHFEELWGCELNRRQIPFSKGKAIYEIVQLYPETDLMSLIMPKKTQSRLKTDLTRDQAKMLFLLLKRFGYLEKSASEEDFLSIMGLLDFPYSPVNWVSKGKNSLVYLVMVLFKPLNSDIHKKVCDCFTYNGKSLNYGTLKTQGSYVMKHRDKFDFVDTIDGIIAKVRDENQ